MNPSRLAAVIAAVTATALLAPASLPAQEQRPVAALGRVAAIGDISDGEKAIIYKRVERFLTERFDLISQEEYLAAEEAAFAALDADECTEENCVRLIREYLQIDLLFAIQIIREQSLTQLSITSFSGESRQVSERAFHTCQNAAPFRTRPMQNFADCQATGRGPGAGQYQAHVPYLG